MLIIIIAIVMVILIFGVVRINEPVPVDQHDPCLFCGKGHCDGGDCCTSVYYDGRQDYFDVRRG